MKKFTVPCDFNGVKSPFTIYVGSPKDDHHPIHFQSDWLSKERGGNVPQEVMDSLSQLRDIATKNGVSFEDLCVYALGAAQQEEEAGSEDESGSDDADSSTTGTDTSDTDNTTINSVTDDSSTEGSDVDDVTDQQTEKSITDEQNTDQETDNLPNEKTEESSTDDSEPEEPTDDQAGHDGIKIATKKVPASDTQS